LGAFVYSICNNVVMEFLRDKGKRGPWDERVVEQRDPGAGIERELVNEEQSRQIRRLMNGMTPKDRFLICAIFSRRARQGRGVPRAGRATRLHARAVISRQEAISSTPRGNAGSHRQTVTSFADLSQRP
jgi:hypothetical protein